MDNSQKNILDMNARGESIYTMRSALRMQFPNTGCPVPMRVKDWERTLSLRSHAKSTRSVEDAECFTFAATLRYKMRTPLRDNTELCTPLETSCFVKFAWKAVDKSQGAFAERKLICTDLDDLLRMRQTPCLPHAIHEFKLPNDAGLAAWSIYRDLVRRTEKDREGTMRVKRARSVHLLAMEACGDMTLSDYLCSKQTSSNDIVQIFLMLIHALAALSKAGISHNDLHLRNIVVQVIPSTVVSFSGRVFRTSVVPIIIDWDMGCSTRQKNRSLRDYGHVGIFNTHNPVFDLFGVIKSLRWEMSVRSHPKFKGTVMSHDISALLVATLEAAFSNVVQKYPWLFAFYIQNEDGDRTRCVQQTMYMPNPEATTPVAEWPSGVRRMTPSFDTLQSMLHTLIETNSGPENDAPRFTF